MINHTKQGPVMINKIYKAVFFDLDGTLVEAKEWHYLALNEAITEVCGVNYTISQEQHINRFDGLSTKQKLKILSNEFGLDTEVHNEIFIKKQEHTIKFIEKFCTPKENITKSLFWLKDNEAKIAVCTNSITETMNCVLRHMNIENFFDLKLSNENVKNPKPDPEIYLLASKHFGLLPEECVVVEDNEKGFRSATKAGCKLIKINNPEDITVQNLIGWIND
jgi:beta-phosphoglucomutase-like phosphatase (HAD superfamily)